MATMSRKRTTYRRVSDLRMAWELLGDGRPPWIRFVARACLDGAISNRLALNAAAYDRRVA